MNKSQVIEFSPEFRLCMPKSYFFKDGEDLSLGYNVTFPDERGICFARMEFIETSLGSDVFLPLPDTCIQRHEILHKDDPRASNMGVAFLSISPTDRVNDPTNFPVTMMEPSDMPFTRPCVLVSYHKTEEDAFRYKRIISTIVKTARMGKNNAMETILPLLNKVKQENVELSPGYRLALNKHEIEKHLPLTIFNDYGVPRSCLSNETISSLFKGKGLSVTDYDDNPEMNDKNGVIVDWDGEKGKFLVRLAGESDNKLLPAKNISLQELSRTDLVK